MSDHLRFTPDEYQSLCQACSTLRLCGSYSAFQRAVANVLRCIHPALADRIDALSMGQVRTLRSHLEAQRGGQGQGSLPDEARCHLSLREWQAISQACALIWLREDCPQAFQGHLVGEVREVEPALAAKLGRLDEGQVATLYRRVKSGKRWSA